MKKKFILLLIFVLTIFFNISVIRGDVTDYNSSSKGSSASGKGKWNPVSGFRIVILDDTGKIVTNTKRLNVINYKVSDINSNWSGTKITSNYYSKVEYIVKDKVSSRTDFSKKISASNVYYYGDITNLGEFGHYLNDNGIKVSGVDNYFSKNSYSNLKILMKTAGYTCFNSNPNKTQCENTDKHYVSIEPITLIDRDLGTAFELAGFEWGTCTQSSFTGHCWYKNVFVNMHNSLYVSVNKNFFNNKINGNNKSTSGKTAYNNINTDNGVAIGIYKITDVGTPTEINKTGTLIINKIDNHDRKVVTAKFNIYRGYGCSGTKVYNNKTVPGSLSLSLNVGYYSIKEVENSDDYENPEGTCVNVEIKENESVTKTFTNVLKCSGEVNYITQNYSGDTKKQELIKLYNKPENSSLNGLLDFDNPRCEQITTCNSMTTETTGCLSASFQPGSSFSSNNVSCYTNKVTTSSGDIAFCQTTLTMNSYVGGGPFSGKSGQMYLTSSDGKAIRSILSMNCYLFGVSPTSIAASNYNTYIPNVQFDKKANNDAIYLDSGANPDLTLLKQGNTQLYSGSVTVDYYFKKIYSDNITGHIQEVKYDEIDAPCTNCKFLEYGKISKLTDQYTNRNMPFNFELQLENTHIFNGNCKATVQPELISPPPTVDPINLVFRLVNTNVSDGKNAFLDKNGNLRPAKKNWENFEYIIKDNNNSYNKKAEASPKYEIILNSETILAIRNHNKQKAYDDNNFTCKPTTIGGSLNGDNVCISNYLTKLKDDHGLEINNSAIRACFEGVNRNSATCEF